MTSYIQRVYYCHQLKKNVCVYAEMIVFNTSNREKVKLSLKRNIILVY